MSIDVDYYSGTFYWWDEDDNANEHRVVWAEWRTCREDPDEWVLIEVDGKEEHECDSEIWQKCEEGFGNTALTLCMEI